MNSFFFYVVLVVFTCFCFTDVYGQDEVYVEYFRRNTDKYEDPYKIHGPFCDFELEGLTYWNSEIMNLPRVEVTNESFKAMIDSVNRIVKADVDGDLFANGLIIVRLAKEGCIEITASVHSKEEYALRYFSDYNGRQIFFKPYNRGFPIDAIGQVHDNSENVNIMTVTPYPRRICWAFSYDKKSGKFRLGRMFYKVICFSPVFFRQSIINF